MVMVSVLGKAFLILFYGYVFGLGLRVRLLVKYMDIVRIMLSVRVKFGRGIKV